MVWGVPIRMQSWLTVDSALVHARVIYTHDTLDRSWPALWHLLEHSALSRRRQADSPVWRPCHGHHPRVTDASSTLPNPSTRPHLALARTNEPQLKR